jgi:hypothetical protein
LLRIDEPREYDVANVFEGIGRVYGGCGFDLYHEYSLFYAVEPHFFFLIPETNVELCNVGLAPPGGVSPLATDSPDAPDDPAVG